MVLKRKVASAGLFATLAILALCFTISVPSYPYFLYGPTTVTTLFLSPKSLLFTIALASAFSSLVYSLLSSSQFSSLNRLLVRVHFVLLAMALLAAAEAIRSWASALSYASRAGSTTYIVWHFRVVQVGFVVVGLGCVIFLVNLYRASLKSCS